MPKERSSGRKKTQHEKFKELARELGADESEDAFVRTLRKIAQAVEQERQLKLPFDEGTK